MIIRYRHRHLHFWFYDMERAEIAIQTGNLLQYAILAINVDTGQVVKDRHGSVHTLDLVRRKGIMDFEDAHKQKRGTTMTPAQEKGLQVGDKVISTHSEYPGRATLVVDDGSNVPKFRMETGNPGPFWIPLPCIQKVTGPTGPTPASRAGFEVGDIFRAKPLATPEFDENELIILYHDDGSRIPKFQSLDTGKRWFMGIDEEYIAKVSDGTPATKAGITKGRTYRVKNGSHQGLEVVLHQDDGTDSPFFQVKESGNIYYISVDKIEEVDENETAASEAAQNETDEEEVAMSDQTPAQRAGIKVGDKVRVTDRHLSLQEGEVLRLKTDDDTNIPFFLNSLGETVIAHVRSVEKVDEDSDNEIEVRNIRLGDPIEKGDLILSKSGERYIVDMNMQEPDSDDEYSISGGYISLEDIDKIVRVRSKEQPKPVEVTIKLEAAEVKAIKEARRNLVPCEIDEDEYDHQTRSAWVDVLDRLGENL